MGKHQMEHEFTLDNKTKAKNEKVKLSPHFRTHHIKCVCVCEHFHKADHLCLFVFRLLTFTLPLEADLKFQFPFRHVKMSSEDPTPLIHHPKKRQHIHGVIDSHHNNPTLYSQWKC